jgi:hypothetical protein
MAKQATSGGSTPKPTAKPVAKTTAPAASGPTAAQLAALVSQTNSLASAVKTNATAVKAQSANATALATEAKATVAAQIADNKTLARDTNQAVDNTTGMIVAAGSPNSTIPAGSATTLPDSVTPVTTDPLVQLQMDAANAARVDAFKLLEDAFTGYGLADLVPTIKELMTGYKDPVTGKITQVGPNEATLLLKATPAYKARFAGNTTRVNSGLNALSEAQYLSMEDSYANLFTQYGQSSFANKAEFASLIGGDVSATELNSRLDLAVARVQNADPNIKSTLQQFYPGITDSDLVSYFLKPEETLPQLQQKVTSAEIGTAATEQGLQTSVSAAEDLAKYGVTQQQAQTGYAKIGEVLPAATKLSTIYGEAQIGYDQSTAESEVFKGLASAQRKRQQLTQLEEAAFNGRSGVNQTVNPLGKGLQGSF